MFDQIKGGRLPKKDSLSGRESDWRRKVGRLNIPSCQIAQQNCGCKNENKGEGGGEVYFFDYIVAHEPAYHVATITATGEYAFRVVEIGKCFKVCN